MSSCPSLFALLILSKKFTSADAESDFNIALLKHVRILFEKDYHTFVIDNDGHSICTSYPPFLIIPVLNKVNVLSCLIYIIIINLFR